MRKILAAAGALSTEKPSLPAPPVPQVVEIWDTLTDKVPGHWLHTGAVIALLLLYVLYRILKLGAGSYPYVAKEALFTHAEQKFLRALEEAVGDDYMIFGQVRLCDVIQVQRGLDSKSWGRAFAKIKAKHLDFVICDPDDLSILCAIELDDSTHERKDRKKRDHFLNHAMAKAGVPLHRFPTAQHYDPDDIRKAIDG